MKTEEFDDAIRRKVESVEFPHDDGDVEKVVSYMNLHKAPSFWASYGKLLTYSISSMIITGLLILNVVQHIENKTLLKNISELQQEVAQKDSVSVPQYLSLSHSFVYQNKAKDIQRLSINQDIDRQFATLAQRSLSQESQEEVEILKPKGKRIIRHSTSYFLDKEVFSEDVTQKTLLARYIKNNTDIRSRSTDENKDESTINTLALIPHSLVSLGNSLEKNYPVIGFISTPQDTMVYDNRFSWSDLSFKNISYRVGLGADLLNGFNNVLWVDAFLSDRWSINLGLSKGSLSETEYYSEDDFIRDKGEPFRDKYAIMLPDKYIIKSIETSHSMVRMPISISYQQPLKRGYALFFTLGSQLDLSVNTDFSFHYQEPSGDVEERKGTIEDYPVTFNNANLAIGLQKQWNHIVLQASPFISKQLKTVSYQNQDLILGARVRLLYDFGRK